MEWLDLFRLQRHLWECNENCSAHLYSGKEVHIRQCLACDSGFFVLKQNIAGLKTLYIQGCSAQQSTEQVQILVCEVDFCPKETLQKMCQKATDIFEAVRRPIYQDCFVNGEHDNKYNLINGQHSGSLQQCAIACNASSQCKGFSYNILEQICTPKTSFSLSKIHHAENVISGGKELCEPWMTVYRQSHNIPSTRNTKHWPTKQLGVFLFINFTQ